MAHIIEVAKTGRAKCRKCKASIAKDLHRFGHEVPNAFAEGELTHQWYHLACAAAAQPLALAQALAEHVGEIPERAALEADIAANKKNVKPSTFPYAERAPSGRSSCLACEEKIEKGVLRVAIEREVDGGTFARPSAGYLHPGCAVAFIGQDAAALLAALRAHSTQLEAADWAELALSWP